MQRHVIARLLVTAAFLAALASSSLGFAVCPGGCGISRDASIIVGEQTLAVDA